MVDQSVALSVSLLAAERAEKLAEQWVDRSAVRKVVWKAAQTVV